MGKLYKGVSPYVTPKNEPETCLTNKFNVFKFFSFFSVVHKPLAQMLAESSVSLIS